MKSFGKSATSSLSAFGIIAIVTLVISALCISAYGLYLAFSASIVLGIIVLLVEPSPFIIGLYMLFGKDVASAIQNWIHFPI